MLLILIIIKSMVLGKISKSVGIFSSQNNLFDLYLKNTIFSHKNYNLYYI